MPAFLLFQVKTSEYVPRKVTEDELETKTLPIALAIFNRRLCNATFHDKQSTPLVFLARQAGDLLVTEFGVRCEFSVSTNFWFPGMQTLWQQQCWRTFLLARGLRRR